MSDAGHQRAHQQHNGTLVDHIPGPHDDTPNQNTQDPHGVAVHRFPEGWGKTDCQKCGQCDYTDNYGFFRYFHG